MVSSDKSNLRSEARIRRAALAAAYPDFAQRLAVHAGALPIKSGSIIGGYQALPDEADPALLLDRLAGKDCHIAFPRVAGRGLLLEFHHIPDGEMLRAGAYGIREPADHFPKARPDLLLLPLLAYDGRGHRLGYGGGFYDRTLDALKIPAIGIAFAGQEVSSIPAEAHDRRLDFILTEHGLRRFS